MKNKIWIVILILSGVFIISGGFEFFENSKINKASTAIGFILQMIFFSKIFWHRNVVQWNKKGVVIRINSFFGKSLSFNQITTTELNDKKLIVIRKNGNNVTFDLNGISEPDTQKLNEIIVKNMSANNS